MDYTFARSRVFDEDAYQTRLDVEDALAILDRLPMRLRRIALLRALGMRHNVRVTSLIALAPPG